MTVALCTLLSILLFSLAVLTSRDVVSFSPIRMNWGFHGISLLLILVALNSRGIWYDADTYLGDLWTASEAVHKTAQGLRSSTDYFSPIGPVQHWLYGVTLLFHAPSAYSIILANVCVAILALVLSYVLLRRRASALTIAIVGLIGVTTALSPRDIDAPLPDIQTSFLGPYNRWSWALLIPVAMRAALPFRTPDPIGAGLFGLALALLVLLKVTYGFAAIGIYLVAQILQPGRWREGALVALSFGLTLLLADVASSGQVRAYLADLGMTAQMPSNGLRLTKLVLETPTFVFFAFGALILLIAVARSDADQPRRPLLQNWRALTIALATGGSGLIVLMQNHYKTEATTLLLMPLIVGEWTGLLAASPSAPEPIWRRRHGEWIALLVLATVARPAIDAGFILAQKAQLFRKAPLPEFVSTEFRDLVIEKTRLPDAKRGMQQWNLSGLSADAPWSLALAPILRGKADPRGPCGELFKSLPGTHGLALTGCESDLVA